MSSLTMTRVSPEPAPLPDYFDFIPDSIVLIILNLTADVKSLGRISSVSRRFRYLVPQVHSLLLKVDCVISDDDDDTPSPSIKTPRSSTNPLSSLFRLVVTSLFKPLLKPLHLLIPRRAVGTVSEETGGGVTHHSPTQVLRNFNELRFLRIELPSGELGVEDGVFLRWKARFGSTLDSCVILGASSVTYPISENNNNNNNNSLKIVSNGNNNGNGIGNGDNNGNGSSNDDNGSIPESFYTNGGLKLRVVWTISSLIAASARHYLLQQIIAEHKTLNSLVLTDSDGQGVLCMNKEQLEELRVKPLSASSASKRTLVPALNMRLWYAPVLELGDGTVLKGATLVAIRPSEVGAGKREEREGEWVEGAFEEPFGMAASMLVKRRTYCLEMNSF